MESFETLIRASETQLAEVLARLRMRGAGEGAARRGQLGRLVGVNVVQLVCGVGFNPALRRLADLPSLLGFASLEGLLAERNYLFIHDRYRALGISDIVEIYTVLGAADAHSGLDADLIISRLNSIEGQLEETINPVLVGGYKLEMRALYVNRLADAALVNRRLGPLYAVLREITGEGMVMLETGTVAATEFLRHAGVTIDEKSRGVFLGLIPAASVQAYLAAQPAADPQGKLRAALAAGTT
ncbi:MAG: hypothetical protein EXR83_00640 [Gammaproteobacteria bacterium]|nr:hypothetical protein [Gammaproteobacteria bacterium]